MNDLSWLWKAVEYGIIALPEAVAFIVWLKHIKEKKDFLEKMNGKER